MNAEKLLRRWQRNLPKDATAAEVEAVIQRYLSGLYREVYGGSSHAWVIKPGPYLESFSIPVQHGKVKSGYVKRLIRTIESLEGEHSK